MRKKSSIRGLTICLIILFQFASVFSGTDRPRDEIKLERYTKTRSGADTRVNAYADDLLLVVEIVNYTGMVQVEITGMGGAETQTAPIEQAGVCMANLSALPKGEYTVRILLENQIYKGSFEK